MTSFPARFEPLVVVLLLIFSAAGLSGCVGAAVGAGATAGIAVAQERSVGAAIDDATVKILVNGRLLRESDFIFTRTSVDVVEGRVLLTGVIPSQNDRDTAGRLAWEVKGVREVLNEIQVSPRFEAIDFVKDASISAQLRFKLLGDRDIYSINYVTTTVNGIVYVIGISRTEAEHQKLLNHARAISGVVRVISHVIAAADPRRKPSA